MPFARVLPLAAILLVGCLHDAPLAPRDEAHVAFAVAGGVLPGTTVEARIYWVDPVQNAQRENVEVTLASVRAESDGGLLRLPLLVDLRPCLPASRSPAQAFCDVFLELKLLEDGALTTHSVEGPIRLAPGATAVAPLVYVAQASTPPTLLTIEPAEQVDPGLVRVRYSAADVDGDLLGVDAELKDSTGLIAGTYTLRFPAPYATFAGALYLPAQEGAAPALLKLSVWDTRRNSSLPLATSVLQPLPVISPEASGVAGTITEASVDLTFTVTDLQGDAELVDVVFRNQVDGEIVVADTIYGTCRRSITSGNGRKSVSCPRVPAAQKALVIVVPFDATGNFGRAGRCAMSTATSSFSCAVE